MQVPLDLPSGIEPAPADFRAKLAAKQHFLRTVLNNEKIFLIGDEHELGRLAKK